MGGSYEGLTMMAAVRIVTGVLCVCAFAVAAGYFGAMLYLYVEIQGFIP